MPETQTEPGLQSSPIDDGSQSAPTARVPLTTGHTRGSKGASARAWFGPRHCHFDHDATSCPAQSAFQAIRASVPPGPDSYLVCGTRSREHKRGLLSGTVAERLLRSRHCHVLAIRVVQPGLLGLPRQLLLPVSGHPRGFRSGLPLLTLLAPDVSHLQILYVARVSRWQFRLLSRESAEQLRRPGQAYCDRIEQEIRAQLGPAPPVVDGHVVVSDDVPKAIVIAANKAKSRLIYLGASERNLTERFFFGNPVEQVLRDATCDVAIYRGLA